MNVLGVGTVFAAIAVVSLCTIVLVLFALSQRRMKRARRQALLADSLGRLKAIVAELLEKVDGLHEGIKYLPIKDDIPQREQRIANAASDLVTIGECISPIEELLKEKRFDEAADLLSASLRLLEKVVRVLAQVEPATGDKLKLREGESLERIYLESGDIKMKLVEKDGSNKNSNRRENSNKTGA